MNQAVYDFFVNREHHRYRKKAQWHLGEEYAALGLVEEYQDHIIARQAYAV